MSVKIRRKTGNFVKSRYVISKFLWFGYSFLLRTILVRKLKLGKIQTCAKSQLISYNYSIASDITIRSFFWFLHFIFWGKLNHVFVWEIQTKTNFLWILEFLWLSKSRLISRQREWKWLRLIILHVSHISKHK